MSSLSNLPDIEFVSSDKATVVADVMALYTQITGRTLAQGDPVRLFLMVIANMLLQQRAYINYTGKQNLLRYATGDSLDHLGALVGCERIEASAATTTIKISLSEARAVNTTIPAGTRVTAGDNVFFAIDNDTIVYYGSTSTTASATCTVTGDVGNGYTAGEINTIVDPVPFVVSMVNTTTSEGGADIEDDDSYRESIHEAPESFNTAGSSEAYKYIAKRASSLINDVTIMSPEPGDVNVIILLDGGEVPGTELINTVLKACNDTYKRPLTDNVSVLAPTVIDYDVSLTYYINQDDETLLNSIVGEVESAVDDYVAWQKEKLGRDINPSELTMRVMNAGAKRVVITSPSYQELDLDEVAIAGNVTVNLGGVEVD